jgi:maltoporin
MAAAMLISSISISVHADETPLSDQQVDAIAKKVVDGLGIQFSGYMRGGFYAGTSNAPAAGYQLGGELDHYRLGNEGDNYFELLIGKKWDMGNGVKVGTYYMPTVYNGSTGTAQVYTDISGIADDPSVTLWAGQRYHRIQDVHILDNWLMQDGDNFGAGVDGLKIGSKGATLNVAAYTQGSEGNHNNYSNNAKRINLQLRNIPTNPGGKLTITAGLINGTFAIGSNGDAFGLLHNQDITDKINNSLFIQASNGHASLTGEFYNLDNVTVPQAGAQQVRLVDAVNWQLGPFGGQALMGYERQVASDTNISTIDNSIGGRVSYGLWPKTKLLGEVGLTKRDITNQSSQMLNKATLAVAYAPNADFWTRPEFRLYVTHANWNDAASAAGYSFTANGSSAATTYGAQIEYWW